MQVAAGARWRRASPGVVFTAIALGSALLVWVWAGPGPLSPPGLALIALCGLAAAATVAYWKPGWLVALPPILMPLPLIVYVFSFEILLGLLAIVLVLRSRTQREPWLTRLEDVEIANLALIGWALFSGLWCADGVFFVLGMHRMLLGAFSFWVAYRLARIARREDFEAGLVLGASGLALATVGRRLTSGLTAGQALMHRGAATDLGWGWANYIAAILVLLTPLTLHLAMHAPRRPLRAVAWPALPLIAAVQGIAIARGALVLFVGAIFAQLGLGTPRGRRLWVVVGTVVGLALLLGPWAEGIVHRFTSARELGSGAVRLWYWQAAWDRTLEHFPWGVGVGQGYVTKDRLGVMDPHDYFLVLSSELGVLGPPMWIVVLALLWRRIARVARDPRFGPLGLALQVTFWCGVLNSVFEPLFTGAHYQFLFFWIFGFYLGHYTATEGRSASLGGMPVERTAS